MRNSTGDIARDPRMFEGFLMQQGYAPDRARAIAAKRIGSRQSEDEGNASVADLVSQVKARQTLIEEKGLFGGPVEIQPNRKHLERFARWQFGQKYVVRVNVLGTRDAPLHVKVQYYNPQHTRTGDTAEAAKYDKGSVVMPIRIGDRPGVTLNHPVLVTVTNLDKHVRQYSISVDRY